MKVMRFIFAVFAVCAIAPSLAVASTHLGGNLGLGAANDNVDNGLSLQGYLELDAAPTVAVRGTAIYYGGDIKVDVLSDGRFTMFGVEGSVIFKLPSERVTPFGGVGLGFYMPQSGTCQRF